MSDNFFREPEPVKAEEPKEPEKITLGEKQYSQDELSHLVGLGERAAEIEKNHGSFDKFVTEAGRRADEIGKMKRQLSEVEAERARQAELAKAPQSLSEEQLVEARRQLTSLLGGEPITQNNFTKMYVAMREGEKLIDECDSYATEINGTDGRPKFDRDEIIAYMAETGIKKPLMAYKDKYENDLKEWEAGQLAAKSKKMTTMEPSGETEPKVVKPNRNNLTQMIAEAMYGPTQE